MKTRYHGRRQIWVLWHTHTHLAGVSLSVRLRFTLRLGWVGTGIIVYNDEA
jgi:hypothetical protein